MHEGVYSHILHYKLHPVLRLERSLFVRTHHVLTCTLACIPLATLSTLYLKRSKINIRRRIPTHYRISSRDRRITRRIREEVNNTVTLARFCQDTRSVDDFVAGSKARCVHRGVPQLLSRTASAACRSLAEEGYGGATVLCGDARC